MNTKERVSAVLKEIAGLRFVKFVFVRQFVWSVALVLFLYEEKRKRVSACLEKIAGLSFVKFL